MGVFVCGYVSVRESPGCACLRERKCGWRGLVSRSVGFCPTQPDGCSRLSSARSVERASTESSFFPDGVRLGEVVGVPTLACHGTGGALGHSVWVGKDGSGERTCTCLHMHTAGIRVPHFRSGTDQPVGGQ